ncbi:hypothetical protein MSP8886_03146 [Marinomonas spartinae]|uniref:Uncharacterized protein n=1 Tax=Marinomonas spartinae TaxID=1792290 RepID=A0A1A8TPP2_9GAMM|nr:hypothetical protein [Marinomonas spartinae]SBS34708.1 hypothetical protein MSP8886_03146 [Marinomonas spartinae]
MISTSQIIEMINKDRYPENWVQKALSILNNDHAQLVYSDCGSVQSDVKSELSTLKIHQESVKKSGGNILGFQELITSLEAMTDQENSTQINIVGYRSDDGLKGKFFFSNDYSLLLGGLIINSNRVKKLRTPPNWDGSQEMIDKYNSQG